MDAYGRWTLAAILGCALAIAAVPFAAALWLVPAAKAASGTSHPRKAARQPYSVPRLPGYACPLPRVNRFHYRPSGCAILASGQTVTLPASATEADVWTLNGQHRLRQQWIRAAYGYGFSYGPLYAAGWDIVNRDIHNYGRTVITYYWNG